VKTASNISRYLLVLIALTCANAVFGQVAKIEPEQPKWGATLTVIYNPKADGAKLTTDDDTYLTCALTFPDHTEHTTARMNRVGGVLTDQFVVRANTAAIGCSFITLNDADRKVTVSTLVYRPDGVPVKGAYQSKAFGKQYQELARKELELYPDNYAMYRDKWFAASNIDRENYLAVIKDDMAALLTKVNHRPADLLYSLSYGYLLLGQEEKSREMLKVLVKQYPASALIYPAFSSYEYQVYSQQIKSEGTLEIQKLKRDFVQQYPDTELARETVLSLAYDKEFPLSPIEIMCQKWSEKEPDNPLSYFSLAKAYSLRQQKLEQGATLIERAINLLLEGNLRLADGGSSFQTDLQLPRAYLISAQIALYQSNFSKALSSVKAAQLLAKQTESQSYMLEGEIWKELAQPTRAEAAYFEAWRGGGKDAEAALRTIYEQKNGGLAGFDDYVRGNKNTNAASGPSSGTKPAPLFNVTSLDGEKLDLEALRGKVVVLNFWFIGCAPCRVEMPGLNQLASEFKGKDVVFIAISSDSAEDLRTFLKKNTFGYHIVPEGSKIAQTYELNGAYPTHIVIGRDGRIISRLTGGSDKRHDDLSPLIERALSEGAARAIIPVAHQEE
jgi:peroxiredoxin